MNQILFHSSPVDDEMGSSLDLNALIIQHPASTFFIKVVGDSMTGAGIFHEDILVIDRSLEAVSGKIILAIVNGEFAVKRLNIQEDRVILEAANPLYSPIFIGKQDDFQIWGVVTCVIHKV